MRLREAIARYVEQKRSLGLLYLTPERKLRSFVAKVGDIPVHEITVRQVSDFLSGPQTSPPTWQNKYNLLRHFFEYWAARGELHSIPVPEVRPLSPQTFRPYIYSRTEIRLLLRATCQSQKHMCVIEPQTLRMILLFLYATGALTGEVLRLRTEDVDLRRGFVTIRSTRFQRWRRIPIGPDLLARLTRYYKWSVREGSQSSTFFHDRHGKPINTVTLNHTFGRLRRITGIARHDDSRYQPRMHDLRHTFAVHSLTAWFKQKADLNRLLPALAAYIGQVGLGSTERYLGMTPERFRQHLSRLSPQRRKKHWRDDLALMKYLETL